MKTRHIIYTGHMNSVEITGSMFSLDHNRLLINTDKEPRGSRVYYETERRRRVARLLLPAADGSGVWHNSEVCSVEVATAVDWRKRSVVPSFSIEATLPP